MKREYEALYNWVEPLGYEETTILTTFGSSCPKLDMRLLFIWWKINTGHGNMDGYNRKEWIQEKSCWIET